MEVEIINLFIIYRGKDYAINPLRERIISFCLFILRERERVRGEAKRAGEREKPNQALHCQHRAQSEAQTHKP